MDLEEIFPQLAQIKDEEIKRKTKAVIEEAVKLSGWDDIRKIPWVDSWTLETYEGMSLVEHTKIVTDIAIYMAKRLMETGFFEVNMDELISAAILHDIGEALEFEPDPKGGVRKRWGRRLLRHPLLGGALALKHGLPPRIAHIISAHSREGDLTERTVEAVILYHADWTPYDCLKAKKLGG